MILALTKESENQFVGGIASGAKDTGIGGVIGTDIYIGYGTDNGSGAAAFWKDWYKSTDGGKTFTQLADGTPAARDGAGYAQANSKIYLWGGQTGSVANDSWYYDGSAWTQISSAMTGRVTTNTLFGYAYLNGYFYEVAGGSSTNIYKSADLITWSVEAALPTALQNLTACSVTAYQGALWIVGGTKSGVYNTKLYKYTPGGSFELILDNAIFGYSWPKIVGCNDFMVYIKGTSGSNVKGCYWSEDGVTWNQFNYEHEATHGPTGFASADGSMVYIGQGNFQNSFWRVRRLDL